VRKSDRCLEFNSRFVQSVLQSTQEAKGRRGRGHCSDRARLLAEATVQPVLPLVEQSYSNSWLYCNSKRIRSRPLRLPNPDRSPAPARKPAEPPVELLGGRPIEYSPAADEQVLRVGVGCPFLIDAQTRRRHELEVKGPRKPAKGLVLSWARLAGLVSNRSACRCAPLWDIGQLYIDPSRLSGLSNSSFDLATLPDGEPKSTGVQQPGSYGQDSRNTREGWRIGGRSKPQWRAELERQAPE
jgi:hypothetical protein